MHRKCVNSPKHWYVSTSFWPSLKQYDHTGQTRSPTCMCDSQPPCIHGCSLFDYPQIFTLFRFRLLSTFGFRWIRLVVWRVCWVLLFHFRFLLDWRRRSRKFLKFFHLSVMSPSLFIFPTWRQMYLLLTVSSSSDIFDEKVLLPIWDNRFRSTIGWKIFERIGVNRVGYLHKRFGLVWIVAFFITSLFVNLSDWVKRSIRFWKVSSINTWCPMLVNTDSVN